MPRKAGDMIKMGLFYWPGGHHIAGWRHPEAETDGVHNFRRIAELARTCERGKFHFFFLADLIGIWPRDLPAQSRATRAAYFEPLTLIGALSAVTEKIGFVATASTTYNEPYHIARKFASLDNINGGRTGWNLVTSHAAAEAANFSRDQHAAHGDRYVRAREFAEVVMGLWDSWEDGAILEDKEQGRYFDPDKLHFLNHVGPNFQVRGPLNVPRSPQGRPIIVQAGSSNDGRDLAAATADVIFAATNKIEDGQAFHADIKARTHAKGRNPDHIAVMPGIFPIIGGTEAEAQRKYEELQALVEPEIGLFLLSHLLGTDVSGFNPDKPLPDLPENSGAKGRREVIMGMARREGLTLRELYLKVAVARGHNLVIGTPEQVADVMERWFLENACDGFNLLPPTFPTGLDDFVDGVVPILQQRGLYRTDYVEGTLRDNLGLPYPENRLASARGYHAADRIDVRREAYTG
jgi:FMN-dependent oxidoreductase (nitrilotriacetate monooxygenase family)